MDALKRVKTAERKAYTTAFNRLENLLKETVLDNDGIELALNLFSQKNDKLDITHQSFLDGISDDTEFATEFEGIEVYRERAFEIIFRAQKWLGKSKNNSERVDTNISNIAESSSNIRPRLPEIELKRFSGDLKEWLSFWNHFQKIHDNKCLTDSEKFHYLIQSTEVGSDPREIIESYPVTNENYSLALESLTERYGKEENLIEVYIRELLKLVLNNVSGGGKKKSKSSLNSLYNKLSTQLRALTSLGVTNDKYAIIIFPLIESALPNDVLRIWERERIALKSETGSDLNALLAFLKREVQAEERIRLTRSELAVNERSVDKSVSNFPTCSKDKTNIASATELFSAQRSEERLECVFCSLKNHESKFCRKAFSMPLAEKLDIIKKRGLCLICMTKGHISRFCRSKIKCFNCVNCGEKGRHLKVMCPLLERNKTNNESNTASTSVNDSTSNDAVQSVDTLHTCAQSNVNVFLQTIVVKLVGNKREKIVRLILDTGSQRSYILKSTAMELGYQSQGEQLLSHSLFGGATTKEMKHHCYKIQLGNIEGNYMCNLDALDQELICNDIPSISYGSWLNDLQLKNIHLSDVGKEGPIEVLLGSDVLGKLYTGKREVLDTGLVALQTKLGWSLSGKFPHDYRGKSVSMTVTSMFSQETKSIPNLWDLEVIGIRDPIEQRSKEETKQAVLLHFQETVRVREDGRFEVNMPWKIDHSPLPDNYEMAVKRLTSTYKKIEKGGLLEKYQDVLDEWKREGIVEDVPDNQITTVGHYLAHRPVVKESSTFSIRPVFDASAKLKNQPSLNDCLETGVNLIESIPSILSRFRRFKIGVVSDIRKAFLQISLNPKERDFLRFLWYDEKGNLKILRHTRVVFGVTCSPYLLGAVIEHHLLRESSKATNNSFTNIVIEKLRESFYVDNCVTSINNESNIEPFIKEAIAIMNKGKFDLRGWEHTALDTCSLTNALKINVLGLMWDKQADILAISSEGLNFDENDKITKRKILSLVNKVFDPIGFITPAVLQPKLLLQSIWKNKEPWDAEVNNDVKRTFLKWTKELPHLMTIRIPRWIGMTAASSISLHIFCDASKIAYAAVVFVRCQSTNGITVQLLQAKSRIAPMKVVTIPRMELLAATIGARLCTAAKDSLKLGNIQTFFWTDSSTVLTWIRRNDQWGTFVGNRIREIRQLTDPQQWLFVPGHLNPADLPSRGCSPQHLQKTRWWEGPDWLRLTEKEWPQSTISINENEVDSEKRRNVVSAKNTEVVSVIKQLATRISSMSKITRIIAWILRFQPKANRSSADITEEEYDKAQRILFRCVQRECFNKEAERKSLKNLNVYKDSEDILRLKTRLTDEEETEEFLTPLILPSKHVIVERLIEQHHISQKHAGILTLLTILRRKVWILKGRKTIRSVIRKCMFCRRYQAKSLSVPIPALPKDRTNLSHTFQVTGVDLAGPLLTKTRDKYWIVIFTCAVYRAVHLELVPSLSTSAFTLALRRFLSRRGRVCVFYSDNGTNFVGLNRALQTLDWHKIQKEFEVNQIKWKFNPPSSPWWGGFWERLIRILKDLLRKNLGRASLEVDELTTLVCECESIMNNRPLTYVSEDPELRTLTPSMFLQSLSGGDEIPELDAIDRTNLVKRWNYVQKLRENLKQRFKKEYLGFLRSTKGSPINTTKVGDVVLIGSDDKKRLDWPLGVVLEIFPGKDKIHRLAKVRTAKGVYLRPFQRLYPLELSAEDDMPRHLDLQMGGRSSTMGAEFSPISTRSGRVVRPPNRLNL